MIILSVSLYNINGERRTVKFNNKGISIITGGSKKGKSSLLDIVEYCLGSSDCKIPYGPIRDACTWYGVHLQTKVGQTFIARKNPVAPQKSSSDFFISHKEIVSPPEFTKIIKNANTDSILKFLGELIELPQVTTEIQSHQTRSSISLGFKHTHYLYFQNQDEIADRQIIFHRQKEDYLPQMIKDTLPYFMGAIGETRFVKLEELKNAKKDFRRLSKKQKEDEEQKVNSLYKMANILTEAYGLGMIDDPTVYNTDQKKLTALSYIANWSPADENHDNSLQRILSLRKESNELRSQKNKINYKIDDLETYQSSVSAFNAAVDEQKKRLEILGLFKKLKYNNSQIDYSEIFTNSLRKLERELGSATKIRPQLRLKIIELKKIRTELASQLKNIREELTALTKQNNELLKKDRLEIQCAKVAGRASLYLENLTEKKSTTKLTDQLETLKMQIADLEKDLDPELIEETISAQLNCIGEDITFWARELKLEHSQYPIQLDIKKLTVIANTPKGKIPLGKMGSGENWVGYHLVTYMALAKWFVRQNRPIARFLFLDQPSQVYFPADRAPSDDVTTITTDDDRIAVARIFKWLIRIAKEDLRGEYQIIITEHVNILETWFQELICDEKWRGNAALLPQHWI